MITQQKNELVERNLQGGGQKDMEEETLHGIDLGGTLYYCQG